MAPAAGRMTPPLWKKAVVRGMGAGRPVNSQPGLFSVLAYMAGTCCSNALLPPVSISKAQTRCKQCAKGTYGAHLAVQGKCLLVCPVPDSSQAFLQYMQEDAQPELHIMRFNRISHAISVGIRAACMRMVMIHGCAYRVSDSPSRQVIILINNLYLHANFLSVPGCFF
jgi:hypothetical protein